MSQPPFGSDIWCFACVSRARQLCRFPPSITTLPKRPCSLRSNLRRYHYSPPFWWWMMIVIIQPVFPPPCGHIKNHLWGDWAFPWLTQTIPFRSFGGVDGIFKFQQSTHHRMELSLGLMSRYVYTYICSWNACSGTLCILRRKKRKQRWDAKRWEKISSSQPKPDINKRP